MYHYYSLFLYLFFFPLGQQPLFINCIHVHVWAICIHLHWFHGELVMNCTCMGPFINYMTLKGGEGRVSASVTMYTLSIHQYGIMCDKGGGRGGVHNGSKIA